MILTGLALTYKMSAVFFIHHLSQETKKHMRIMDNINIRIKITST